jgi:metal-responsive CopG/Arc/MetJ family transcriptional regulator
VTDQLLGREEVLELAERMRQRALSRHGDQAADVVVVQGNTKETLRLSGELRSVRRVRSNWISL